MAGTTSISGLMSGLDTSTIISQLMQVEAQSQTRLKTRLTAEQSSVKSLQELNTAFAALATAAGDLTKATGWNPVGVSSSSDKVVVTPTAGAVPGALSFTVGQYAVAHRLSFADSAAMTDVVTTGSNTVRLDLLDGTTRDIDTGDGTLAGLVAGLNAAGTGVKASTVRLDDGSYRLQVVSSTTGAASDFTLTNLDGSDLLGGAAITAGQDAAITIGTDTVHSSTNTFTEIANGLTIALKPGLTAGTTVDLDVTQDTSAMTAKVKALVTSANEILAKIDGLTGYNSATKSSGPLAGDASIRALRTELLETVFPGDGTTLSDLGVSLDRYGKLTFDEKAFGDAYAADPAAVAQRFTTAGTGFAARVQDVATSASDSVDGVVTVAINNRNTGVRRLQDDISDWDNRLALRRETLNRQFAALETALSQLNSQSSWLAGQLGSLSSGS